MKIRLTKEFRFECSHALEGYDGLCKNIHGHSYRLFVTILGEAINQKDNPKNGMVMDFSELKKIVNEQVIEKLDHALLLWEDSKMLPHIQKCQTKFIITPYQPTCENLLIDLVGIISSQLPKEISLVKLRLYETSTSYSEWLKEDNQ